MTINVIMEIDMYWHYSILRVGTSSITVKAPSYHMRKCFTISFGGDVKTLVPVDFAWLVSGWTKDVCITFCVCFLCVREVEPPSIWICPYFYGYKTTNTDEISKIRESFGQLGKYNIMWNLLLNTEITYKILKNGLKYKQPGWRL